MYNYSLFFLFFYFKYSVTEHVESQPIKSEDEKQNTIDDLPPRNDFILCFKLLFMISRERSLFIFSIWLTFRFESSWNVEPRIQ